eukprot:13990156-Alexandrium_andersonii.AAC.1
MGFGGRSERSAFQLAPAGFVPRPRGKILAAQKSGRRAPRTQLSSRTSTLWEKLRPRGAALRAAPPGPTTESWGRLRP